MNFNELLKIDDVDKKIIMLLQENPDMTHSDIADKVGKSQPAVGARIIKLKRKFMIATQVGLNFKKVDLKIAWVTFTLKNPQEVLSQLEQCPFIIHAFKTSGATNVSVLIGAADMQDIDYIVDVCFRSDANISNITVNFFLQSVKDLILPLNFDIENAEKMGCGPKCALSKRTNIREIKDVLAQDKDEKENTE